MEVVACRADELKAISLTATPDRFSTRFPPLSNPCLIMDAVCSSDAGRTAGAVAWFWEKRLKLGS